MTGISGSITPNMPTPAIMIRRNNKSFDYLIGGLSYSTEPISEELGTFTQSTIKCFLEFQRHLYQDIHLPEHIGRAYLAKLAKWGGRTYRKLFQTNARKLLNDSFRQVRQNNNVPTPTFISEEVIFPWEILYEGKDYEEILETDKCFKEICKNYFWGFAYAPARTLSRIYIPNQDQSSPWDMLFCLHHELINAHEKEWPQIEQLVKIALQNNFKLLGSDCGLSKQTGKSLLNYLYEASHNMVHFACHCSQGEDNTDVLSVSFIDIDEPLGSVKIIELDPLMFLDLDGNFQRQPLIFLNACQSGGGADELRRTLSLPAEFIKHGAAAVIATAWPVPDFFAAEFARHFYELFLHKHLTIGESLRQTRLHFLVEYNNPLGLAYGLYSGFYSPSHYRVALPPMAGRFVK